MAGWDWQGAGGLVAFMYVLFAVGAVYCATSEHPVTGIDTTVAYFPSYLLLLKLLLNSKPLTPCHGSLG